MADKKLVMIGYRPGRKSRMKKRTAILVSKKYSIQQCSQALFIIEQAEKGDSVILKSE